MLGCTFEAVGTTDGVTLNSLQGEFVDADELQVASLNDQGITEFTSYYYFTEDGGMVDADGWYNGDFESIGDTVRIPVGSAFWFIAENAKGVTVAGQVHLGEYTHTITDKKSMVCSAFPVAFNPNVNCTWDGFVDADEIQVAKVNEQGITEFTSCYYFTEDGGMVDEDGWYNGDFEKITEPIAAAGQGFWLMLEDPSGHVFKETSPVK